jgi:DNA mismatch endonuclease, patch repair protein
VTDVFTKLKRSEIMSHIRGRGNRETELVMARILRRTGITGWRRNQAVFGKPDFVFRSARVALFVDGCFWHNCPKHANLPVTHRSFWRKKLEANRRRDRLVRKTLIAQGWEVVRIWEHDLIKPNQCIQRILTALGDRNKL